MTFLQGKQCQELWGSHQKLERDKERFFPRGLRGRRALSTSRMAEKYLILLCFEKLLIAKDSLCILRTHHLHPVFTLLYNSSKSSRSYLLCLTCLYKTSGPVTFLETFLINKQFTYCNRLNQILSLIALYIFIFQPCLRNILV